MSVNILNNLVTELRSQISLIFYAGMEGLGGLEMDTEEADAVSAIIHAFIRVLKHPQGIDGSIELSGSSPELDDFKIRFEDGQCSCILDSRPSAYESLSRP